jgi:hypothetical protein
MFSMQVFTFLFEMHAACSPASTLTLIKTLPGTRQARDRTAWRRFRRQDVVNESGIAKRR